MSFESEFEVTDEHVLSFLERLRADATPNQVSGVRAWLEEFVEKVLGKAEDVESDVATDDEKAESLTTEAQTDAAKISTPTSVSPVTTPATTVPPPPPVPSTISSILGTDPKT